MDYYRGDVYSTKNRRPLELKYYEAYDNREASKERKKKLKRFSFFISRFNKKNRFIKTISGIFIGGIVKWLSQGSPKPLF